jgi:hypothetical protein
MKTGINTPYLLGEESNSSSTDTNDCDKRALIGGESKGSDLEQFHQI